MLRVARWVGVVLPVAVAAGCQVDERTVICDLACEQGASGQSGAANSTGGSTASGGAKASGGSSASTGGKGSGGVSASGGALAAGGSNATGGAVTAGAMGKGGSSATGGAVSAGGNATGGAVADCTVSFVAAGTTPLIDDFEDGDLNLSRNEGRAGYWSHLRSGVPPSAPAPSLAVLVEAGGRFLRVSGAAIAANPAAYPWALLKTDLRGVGTSSAPRSCVYDAAKYSGIQFRARGVEVRVSVEMDLDVPVSNTFGAPGACTAVETDCYDRHGTKLTLSSGWSSYRLNWSELAQQGFSNTWHPTFDPQRLLAIYFEVVSLPMGSIPDYAMDVDDVEFF